MKIPVVSTVPQGNPFVALGAPLLARLENEQADFAVLCGTSAERPLQTFCHDLVDRWAGAHKGDVVLRGWLLDAGGRSGHAQPLTFHCPLGRADRARQPDRRDAASDRAIAAFSRAPVQRVRLPRDSLQLAVGEYAAGVRRRHHAGGRVVSACVSRPEPTALPCKCSSARASGRERADCAQTVSCVACDTADPPGAPR
ncbi:hypothetical protein R69658_07057 [Paraburkholderia aspalathi]|uniref:Uncharacterized protein n=1 Tax=Paraburkholderia aspalathi TaxID=1324617 RepID=A0ABM8T0W3_9BURK|nr:hypothetical protein R69658_07057 [Paraburkholderia aspalathi]CAE6870973.1 hypothetical protein R69746_08427 [Paraburkholderia aspalathi]